jgi:hypothetical protein
MAAASYDITIEQGATLRVSSTLKGSDGNPLDLTGWTGRAQIRESFSGEKIADFTISFNADRTDGVFVLSLTDAETAAISVPANTTSRRVITKYPYDVELVKPDGTVLRVLQGLAKISPEITR